MHNEFILFIIRKIDLHLTVHGFHIDHVSRLLCYLRRSSFDIYKVSTPIYQRLTISKLQFYTTPYSQQHIRI